MKNQTIDAVSNPTHMTSRSSSVIVIVGPNAGGPRKTASVELMADMLRASPARHRRNKFAQTANFATKIHASEQPKSRHIRMNKRRG
jgi:hypothetical protein